MQVPAYSPCVLGVHESDHSGVVVETTNVICMLMPMLIPDELDVEDGMLMAIDVAVDVAVDIAIVLVVPISILQTHRRTEDDVDLDDDDEGVVLSVNNQGGFSIENQKTANQRNEELIEYILVDL